MMIFGIDVRREICKRYKDWDDFICVRADLKCMLDDEENEMAKEKIVKAMELLDEIITIKAFELKEATKKFEEDYVTDILKDMDLYKNRLKID